MILSRKSLLFLILFSFQVSILFAQPNAGFTVNLPTPACNPALASFSNTSTGVPPLSYQWNFGMNAGINSVLQNPAATYSSCGTFVVSLTVIDGNGQQNTFSQNVVIHCKPISSFNTTGTTGCAPLLSTLTSTSSAGSGTISNYLWDFGDGNTGTNAIENHTYNSSGCKTVTLIITNSFGCTDDSTRSSAVCVSVPPTINYNASPTNACSAPLTTHYISNANGGVAPYTYQWSFPGGVPATSTLAHPFITYNSSGNFSSTLILTDATGCADTITKNNYVHVGTNAAQFTISQNQGCAPLTVNATGMNGVTSWNWTTTPNAIPATWSGQNASFIFSNSGNYQLCETVVFSNGCSVQKCTTIVVLPTPTANFSSSGNITTCQPPLAVSFSNQSSGNNLSCLWSFPGGMPSTFTGANPPVINYYNCGNFPVTLSITNGAGCSSTKTDSNLVNIDCPVAQFFANPSSGCAPLAVHFNSNASIGNPIAWFWNFGDTTSVNDVQSTLENPNHIFQNAGCYTVRLIIVNALDCRDTLIFTEAVCAGNMPVASFTYTPSIVCSGMDVAFTNTSTGIDSTTNYQWDFGGYPFNFQSPDPNPGFNYSDTGWADIIFVVCNYGCCDTMFIDNAIHILPPTAKFTVERDCNNPFTVVLHGGNSIDADLFNWTLTGGTPASSTDSVVTVTYPASGNYTVKLSVTNLQSGCIDQKMGTIKIRNVQAGFTAPTIGCKPFNACFTNTSIDASTYKWQIMDSTGAVIFSSTLVSPCYTFINTGKYSVRLISKDVNLCSDTLYISNYITVYGTYINYSAAPTTGCAPLPVSFTDLSTSPYSFPVNWSWNFGDPGSNATNFSNLNNSSHTYNFPGNYSVKLVVTDNHGCKDSLVKTNFVKPQGPLLDFGALNQTICLGDVACFYNNTIANSNLIFAWNFGDGNFSAQASPCHNYTSLGIYNVTLNATDTAGCSSTMLDSAAVSVSLPIANFIADTTTSTCPPLAVQFSNLSSNIFSATTYLWNFGDGNISSLQNPVHIYNQSGTYDVSLIIMDASGCGDTIVFVNYITISGPTGSANSNIGAGCIPVLADFHVTSNNAVNFVWNFGDGTVINNSIDSASYSYNSSGIFYPEVILSDGLGCVLAIPLGSVSVSSPAAKFIMNPNPICDAGSISFSDSTISSQSIASWTWNFGDTLSGVNNLSTQQNPFHYYSMPGIYPVKLIVTSSAGCTGIFTDTVFVYPSPQSLFYMNDSTACPGQQISFSDNTQSAIVTSWLWNFGDTASGANNYSLLQFPDHAYNNSGVYLITLSVQSAGGCSTTTSNTIYVNDHAIASVSNDTAVCLLNNAMLNAGGGMSYLWSPTTGLNNSTINNPIVSPIQNTTYNVVVTDASGCTATEDIEVTVFSLPTISTSSDTIICGGQNIQLNANGALTYSWFPLTGLNNAGISNPVAIVASSISYNVIGVDINGCSNSSTIAINLFPDANAFAGSDTILCFGNSTQLSGSGGVNYLWLPSGSLDSSGIYNPIASPISSVTYTLIITDANGCTASDNVSILVNALPTVNAGNDEQICFHTTTDLIATGATQYLWSPTTTLSSSTGAIVTASPEITTKYFVSGTDGNGCKANDSVIVFVYPQLFGAAGTGGTICQGGIIQLSASGGSQYLWSPSESLDNPFVPFPFASPMQTTTYTVLVSDGLCSADTFQITVVVNPLPLCNAGQDISAFIGTPVFLGGTSSAGSTYSWSPSTGLSCTDCLTPKVTAVENTTYVLTTTSEDGCRTEDSMIITVVCHDDLLYVPNSFTPDGNNKNDLFRVRGLGIKQLNYFRVFNRWGQLIWETEDINNGWDGTFNGTKLTAGVYVYFLEAVCSDGKNIAKQGNITLIR